jgi:L-arabinokinase
MDQLSSHLGQKNKLLPLICQPHQVDKAISIPRGINFSGIDSGVRHAVSGASYSDVRAAAFMSYSIIALSEGATEEDLDHARASADWSKLPYKGFLANIPVPVFEEKYLSLLPGEISGEDFYPVQSSIDPVTTIDEQKIYKPLVCGYILYENARVNEFKTLLKILKSKMTSRISEKEWEA